MSDYRELTTPEEIEEVKKLINAWQNPLIPERQYSQVVKRELEKDYSEVAPFRAFHDAIWMIPDHSNPDKTILEIGASSGYYGELLRRWGIRWRYTALDYAPEFQKLSEKLFPENQFVVGDALDLPFLDNSFDIVISGCCQLHIYDWKKAVKETIRVAKDDIIMHRTPILHDSPTRFFLKEGYGVPMLEIWFSKKEYEEVLEKNNLIVKYGLLHNPVFERDTEYGRYGMYTINCRKK